MFACGPADATVIPKPHHLLPQLIQTGFMSDTCIWPSGCHCHSLSLASVNSRLVLPFWYRLTRVVLDKGPLNVCVCVIMQLTTAPPDKQRQKLTKSRRATVASSTPGKARSTKITSASSDVESSETETDGKVGWRTAGHHGSRTTAAAAVSSVPTATVSYRSSYYIRLYFVSSQHQ